MFTGEWEALGTQSDGRSDAKPPAERSDATIQLPLALSVTKEDVYLALIAVAEKHTRMQRSPSGSNMRNVYRLAASIDEAEQAGLSDAEIRVALQIGAFRGGHKGHRRTP
jgi:hypothetical protein